MLVTRFLRGNLPGRLLAALFVTLHALAAQAQTGSTPLIWEARSPTNAVYLFGTIHVGGRAIYPLSAAVEQAYAASSVVALEADPTDQSAALTAMQAAIYSPPDNLANHVSPQLMALIDKTLPAIGLPIEYARVMRPHLLAMMIAMLEVGRQGYDPSLGLDVHFARRAKRDGKRLVELESISGQLALLDSFSPDLQEGMLRSAVEGISAGSLGSDVRELVAAWSAGDAERLQHQIDKELEGLPPAQAKEMREQLYDNRNRAMADKIVAMLAGAEPVFVALGAGHLLGDAGIVELLRRKGYAVKPL
jgi:uncharacterized protein